MDAGCIPHEEEWSIYKCAVVFFNEDFVVFEVLVAYDFSSIAFGFASEITYLFYLCLVDRSGGGQKVGMEEEV